MSQWSGLGKVNLGDMEPAIWKVTNWWSETRVLELPDSGGGGPSFKCGD
jgi:hypothetical protein